MDGMDGWMSEVAERTVGWVARWVSPAPFLGFCLFLGGGGRFLTLITTLSLSLSLST